MVWGRGGEWKWLIFLPAGRLYSRLWIHCTIQGSSSHH